MNELRRRVEKQTGDWGDTYDSEVFYIQGNGNYIDTNIIPTSDTGIQVAYLSNNSMNDYYIVGHRTNSSDTRWCIGVQARDNKQRVYCGYGPSLGYTDFSWGSDYSNGRVRVSELNFLNSGVFRPEISYNGTSLPQLSFTPTGVIRIFGSSGVSASYTTFPSPGKIYYVRISQANTIVMDLIPVRVGNEAYMFDKIARKLYYYGQTYTGTDLVQTTLNFHDSNGDPVSGVQVQIRVNSITNLIYTGTTNAVGLLIMPLPPLLLTISISNKTISTITVSSSNNSFNFTVS